MPQLMPLLWVGSVFMVLFLMMMLFDLYYYKSDIIDISLVNFYNVNLMYMW